MELNLDVPEYVRLLAYVLPLELLGIYAGLKKGFNPDEPRNLSRCGQRGAATTQSDANHDGVLEPDERAALLRFLATELR